MNATQLIRIAHHPFTDHNVDPASPYSTLQQYPDPSAPSPSCTLLENILIHLEQGTDALVFPGPIAAINTIIKLLKPAQEIITNIDINPHIQSLFTVFCSQGINIQYVDTLHTQNLEAAITPATRIIWIESPSSTTLQVSDINAIALIARQHNCLLCVDNTLATSVFQQPLTRGADIVLHSNTAFIAGHHQPEAGILIINNPSLAQQLHEIRYQSGNVPSLFDAMPVIRGLESIYLRMRQHTTTAQRIANMLKDHPAIDKVYYPGLITHPNHFIAARQQTHFGGVLSFSLKIDTEDAALDVVDTLKLISCHEHTGGNRSYICHPASSTHGFIPALTRKANGIQDSLLRVSAGLEDAYDLIRDLEQALNNFPNQLKTKNKFKCLSQKAW